MKYKNVDGRDVCNNGEVIIDHIRHKVLNGFVKCDNSLNRSSWNTTKETILCPKCYNKPIQLELNFK